jgi:hypothetical protein
MIKEIFGLTLVIIIVFIYYFIKKNAIPINCACGDPPWWAVCNEGTTIDSPNCAFYSKTMDQINSVYLDINNTFKSLGNTLKNLTIPKIPDMPLNLKELVNTSFNIPKLDTNFTLIPSVNISCAIPNPIKAVEQEIKTILNQLQNIGSGLNNLINEINKLNPANLTGKIMETLNTIKDGLQTAYNNVADIANKAADGMKFAAGEVSKATQAAAAEVQRVAAVAAEAVAEAGRVAARETARAAAAAAEAVAEAGRVAAREAQRIADDAWRGTQNVVHAATSWCCPGF